MSGNTSVKKAETGVRVNRRTLQASTPVEGPSGQQVEVGGGLLRADLQHPVLHRCPTGQTPEQVHHRTRGGVSVGEPKADHGFAVGTTPELGRRVLGDDPALDHHRHPVCKYLHLVHVVAGEEDGRSEGLEALDHLPCVPARRGVKTGGGLIQEEHLRITDEAQRQIHPALLSA